jgi:hypothetical protein
MKWNRMYQYHSYFEINKCVVLLERYILNFYNWMDQSAGPITITKDTKTISDWIVLSKRSPQDYNEYTKL